MRGFTTSRPRISVNHQSNMRRTLRVQLGTNMVSTMKRHPIHARKPEAGIPFMCAIALRCPSVQASPSPLKEYGLGRLLTGVGTIFPPTLEAAFFAVCDR